MHKENKNTRTPRLRFPEFREAGDWEERTLGEVSEIVRGGSPRPIEEFTTTDHNGLNWLKIGDVAPDSKYITQTIERVIQAALSKTREVFPGDLILSNSMSFGRPYILKIRSCIHDGWIAIRRITKGISTDYLYYLISSEYSQNYFSVNAAGAAVKNLNAEIIKALPIVFPATPEQQKIAALLSSLDDLITAQTEKIKALQAHKKGLMQQMFPAEGERTPRVRFREFDGDGEWELEPFDKLYSFFVTNSFSRDDLNYSKGTVKNIHYGDIHTKFATLFDLRKEIVPYVNTSISIDKIKPESYCIEGDMIFADASEDLNDVGKSVEIISLNNEKLLSGLHTLLARQIEPKLIVGFGGHLFKSDGIRYQIKKEAQGAKVLGISAGRLSNIKVYYPKNKHEQQKIAALLTSLDDLITAQREKLDALKSHKKGLMQGLFPDPNNETI
jgi:type I restriction enzyme S subunit